MSADSHKSLSALKGREALLLERFFSIMDNKWRIPIRSMPTCGSGGRTGRWGGQTPLQRMAAGDVTDLAAVRAYADAARAPSS